MIQYHKTNIILFLIRENQSYQCYQW